MRRRRDLGSLATGPPATFRQLIMAITDGGQPKTGNITEGLGKLTEIMRRKTDRLPTEKVTPLFHDT